MTWDGTEITGSLTLTEANCYLTMEAAEGYFAGRLHADPWDTASPTDKAKALVTATRQLNALTWLGTKAADDQPHAFPRTYWAPPTMNAMTRTGGTGGKWSQDSIPQEVLDGCCEQAMFLLAQTAYDRGRARAQANGIIGGGLGKANEYSNAELVTANRTGPVICPDTMRLVGPFLARVADIT